MVYKPSKHGDMLCEARPRAESREVLRVDSKPIGRDRSERIFIDPKAMHSLNAHHLLKLEVGFCTTSLDNHVGLDFTTVHEVDGVMSQALDVRFHDLANAVVPCQEVHIVHAEYRY